MSIVNIGKLCNPAEGRVWPKKLKNAHEQARPYARKVLQWIEAVKEKGVSADLDVGPSDMSVYDAIPEQLKTDDEKD